MHPAERMAQGPHLPVVQQRTKRLAEALLDVLGRDARVAVRVAECSLTLNHETSSWIE